MFFIILYIYFSTVAYFLLHLAPCSGNAKLSEATNIKNLNLDSRIDTIYGDAMDVNIEGQFDLIFIDASKGHSIDFFEKFSENLKIDGVIVTDNLSFHGLVENEALAVTKNQKGLVKRIKRFIEYLNNNQEFSTVYVDVGDKLSISQRREY